MGTERRTRRRLLPIWNSLGTGKGAAMPADPYDNEVRYARSVENLAGAPAGCLSLIVAAVAALIIVKLVFKV